ncbi:MAG: hypothetical protein IKM48_04685, partial [Clostridia bacterium]|nr:hypothetical protein [Clostridia bacterium]
MKLKHWFFLLVAACLLVTSAGCKDTYGAGSEGEEIVYPSLTDEEYYSEPEVIVQATIDVVKKQYTTDPTKSATGKTAEVTVYNIFISNVYRGQLGYEPPSVFHVKIYNTEEEPFYLTVGKKYILGLAYIREEDDEYGDGGGYVIIGPRRWTIQKDPQGSEYRNFAQTTDARSWENLMVLLEKIAEQQQLPEPDPQPVPQPKYTVDGIKKDASITEALREQFYELYRTWRVDAMFEFSPEKPMELELFKYYCAYFVTDEEKSYVDMGVSYTGAAVERIAKRFGMTYGLKADDAVFVKAGSLRSIPFAEVIQYKKETVDGKTLVTARCIEYFFNDYEYSDQEHIEASESYSARKKMIIKGKVTGYDHYAITDFSFYTEDGKTPTQFVSCMGYSPELLADGYQTLPEFVPTKTETAQKPTEEKQPEVTAPVTATVVLDETPELERIGDCLFYYGIKEFHPVLNGKKAAELREIAKTNNIAGYDVFKQGKADAEKGLCEKFSCYSTDHNEPSYDYYEYPDYHVVHIDGLAGGFYLICTPKTDCFALYDKMILMNASEDSVIVPSTKGPVDLGKGVYFYTVQRFMPTIDGKQVDFKQLLQEDPTAEE